MSFSSNHFLLFYSLLLLLLFSPATVSPARTDLSRPKALILPVTKDPKTLQYLTQLRQRTPPVPVKLTLDLGGQFLWVFCHNYVSSSYEPAHCKSKLCHLVGQAGTCGGRCPGPSKPDCHNDTCSLIPDNTISGIATSGGVAQDIVFIQSLDGPNPGRVFSVPKLPFVCGSTNIGKGLAKGVKGMAGIGRGKISLPTQLSSAFKLEQKFAVCLGSTNGAVIFGGGPYIFQRGIDFSKSLTYTPLIKNKVSSASSYFEGDHSTEYFIGVMSIKINGNAIAELNKTLLSIDKKGNGGTKISTVNPYTVMEKSIYRSFMKTYMKWMEHIPRVAPVEPFAACYNSNYINSTRVGPAVPDVDFVLQNENVYWRMVGRNLMVQVRKDVSCLGFINGGSEPGTSIVIGGHQIEDNLLQFDLKKSMLGFSSPLLYYQTSCSSNFNHA